MALMLSFYGWRRVLTNFLKLDHSGVTFMQLALSVNIRSLRVTKIPPKIETGESTTLFVNLRFCLALFRQQRVVASTQGSKSSGRV